MTAIHTRPDQPAGRFALWALIALALCILTACTTRTAPPVESMPLVQTGDDLSTETALQRARDALALRRAQVDARYAAAVQVCNQRFAVNDCERAARAQRNRESELLRQQQALVNAAQRAATGASTPLPTPPSSAPRVSDSC